MIKMKGIDTSCSENLFYFFKNYIVNYFDQDDGYTDILGCIL